MIAKLNSVIDILIEDNTQLRQLLCYNRQALNNIQTPPGIQTNHAAGTNNAISTIHKFQNKEKLI
jgi:hypothetical protein